LTGSSFRRLSVKSGAMPLNAPASLTHDQYVNVMAFILSRNGYKPGKEKLTFAEASSSKAPVIKP
jgi:polar amino acid transport system substrate-binding protein